MEQYRFDQAVSQKIVDGILLGYKNYISEREEKLRTMTISDAYAWVKGNHIDDQTAKECSDLGIVYTKAKAGYTWGYLQFTAPESKGMFIIKNASYFDPSNFSIRRYRKSSGSKSLDAENYLLELAKINSHIEFPENLQLFNKDDLVQEFISIFDNHVMKSIERNDLVQLQNQYDKFYIVTYEIDQAFMISGIHVFMPNPRDGIAYHLEDLTHLIETSPVVFNDVNFAVLENEYVDSNYDDLTAIDFDIYHEDQVKKQKKDNNPS